MRSRLLLNLFLLVTAAGLVLFLVYGEKKKPEPIDVTLTGIQPTNISRIRITRAGQEEVRFEKQSGTWKMQHPYQLPAGDLRISTMLKLLSAHSYAQYQAGDIQLPRFRLDEPQVSIEFNDTRIDFGDTNPLGDQRYVLVNNTVHIINDVLFQQLQAPPFFFVDTRLLPKPAAINAILLPEHAIRIREGVWTVAPAVSISADEIVEIVNAWRNADAISVSKYEDTAPHDSVRIELENQEALEFTIVRAPPQLILARPDLGIQYHLSDFDARQMFLKTTTPEQKQDAPAPEN
ncbi:MAG: DUF4340 domain-containing protein [Gammaproteobacteria bacterium]